VKTNEDIYYQVTNHLLVLLHVC